MPLPPAHQPISETDYEAIEAAVKETARGRWFLDEYAYRNRNADTKLVLDAIQRLQRSVLGADALPAPAPQAPTLGKELREIEHTADETRAVLSQIETTRRRDGDLGKELDNVVAAQTQAITEILSDAERIGEISASLRAQGIGGNYCDRLDGLSAHINTVCAFQDLTGQRSHKVALALRVLEARVAALAKLWQVQAAAEHAMEPHAVTLDVPAKDDALPKQDVSIDHDVFWEEAATAPVPEPAPSVPAQSIAPEAETQTAPQAATPSAPKRTELDRLTFDERLALFT